MSDTNLKARIETLERQLGALTVQLQQARAHQTLFTGTYPFVFLAKDNGDGTFTEWATAGGELTQHAEGRTGPLTDADDTIGVLAQMDWRDGGAAFSFVPIGGGGGLKKVKLFHGSSATYTVKNWAETKQIGAGISPLYRPFGTSIDFVQYASTGIGYYDDDGNFVLILAIEERYDFAGCSGGGG